MKQSNWQLATARGRRSPILIVDDDTTNVILLEQVLKRAGYERVVGVTDPREVDERMREVNPDLVLLDLHMPYVDGYQLLSRWSASGREPAVSVVVLTGDATPTAKRRSLEAGAADVLTKPFDHVEVLLRIRNLLEARTMQAEMLDQAGRLERVVEERTADLRESLSDLRRVDEDRRRLLASLVDAQELERQRLAADISEDPIQKMTALAIDLETLQSRLRDPESKEALTGSVDAARGMIDHLRNLLFLLRPPALDQEGLAAAISQLLERVGRDTGIKHHVYAALASEPDSDVRAIAYRITQEAVTNVGKHAHAQRIEIDLESKEDGVYVKIEDDGVGPQPDAAGRPGLGLSVMSERAQIGGGWWRFGPAAGRGTAVEFWLPNHADGIPA